MLSSLRTPVLCNKKLHCPSEVAMGHRHFFKEIMMTSVTTEVSYRLSYIVTGQENPRLIFSGYSSSDFIAE